MHFEWRYWGYEYGAGNTCQAFWRSVSKCKTYIYINKLCIIEDKHDKSFAFVGFWGGERS